MPAKGGGGNRGKDGPWHIVIFLFLGGEECFSFNFIPVTNSAYFFPVFRIRIHRIHVFFGLPDPDPALDLDPDPSIIMQK